MLKSVETRQGWFYYNSQNIFNDDSNKSGSAAFLLSIADELSQLPVWLEEPVVLRIVEIVLPDVIPDLPNDLLRTLEGLLDSHDFSQIERNFQISTAAGFDKISRQPKSTKLSVF